MILFCSDMAASDAGRLARACGSGKLAAVLSALADGADVTEAAVVPGWQVPVHPLFVAVYKQHIDIVVALLSHGADPNSYGVMKAAGWRSTPPILQLLLDAGGDVNRPCVGRTPLGWCTIWSPDTDVTGRVEVLLSQPWLNLDDACDGKPMEECFVDGCKVALADRVVEEVRCPRSLVTQ